MRHGVSSDAVTLLTELSRISRMARRHGLTCHDDVARAPARECARATTASQPVLAFLLN